MKQLILVLGILLSIVQITFIALFLAIYAIGWIGYGFEINDDSYRASDIYCCFLGIILLSLLVGLVILLCFKRSRPYSLFIVPHLFALIFAWIYSLGNVKYMGHGYLEIQDHMNVMSTITGGYLKPFQCRVFHIKSCWETLIDTRFTWGAILCCDNSGEPWFFRVENDYKYNSYYNCSGDKFQYSDALFRVDYEEEIFWTLSVSDSWIDYSVENDIGDASVFVRIIVRLYSKDGIYEQTEVYRDYLSHDELSKSKSDYEYYDRDDIGKYFKFEKAYVEQTVKNLYD